MVYVYEIYCGKLLPSHRSLCARLERLSGGERLKLGETQWTKRLVDVPSDVSLFSLQATDPYIDMLNPMIV